jgi:hypothetical protein
MDKTRLDVLTQMLLIVFHGQDVIPTAGHNLGRDPFLTTHRVDGETNAPCTSNNSNKRGMASISLDFSSVATWPKVKLASTAQALTKCKYRKGEEPPPE